MSISITVERDSKAGTFLEKVVKGFQRLGCTLDCIRKFHLLFQTLKNKSSFAWIHGTIYSGLTQVSIREIAQGRSLPF